MIEELDALSAWFEISSESESVRSLGGHERFHRTRERGTGYHRGYFRQPSQPTSLYMTPHLPPWAIRVSLRRFCSHPPPKSHIWSNLAPLLETLASPSIP